MAIYGLERAQNKKDMAEFSELICFDHNFLPNAVINLIFDMMVLIQLNLSLGLVCAQQNTFLQLTKISLFLFKIAAPSLNMI